VTLAGYSPGRINVFRPVLKLRNESLLVFRPKDKLFQTRGAATEKQYLATTNARTDTNRTTRH